MSRLIECSVRCVAMPDGSDASSPVNCCLGDVGDQALEWFSPSSATHSLQAVLSTVMNSTMVRESLPVPF